MIPTSFSALFQWTIMHGYPLMLLAMLIEGPIVTSVATFAATLGYFNIWVIFFMALGGDLVGDIVYYAIGYFGRITFVERWGHRFGLTNERIRNIERHLHNHAIKTLLVLKLTPILPTPGLMIVGATHFPIRKFAIASLLITLPKAIIFMALGYFFGQVFNENAQYFENTSWAIFGILVFLIAAGFAYKYISGYIGKRIGKL